MKSLVLAIAFLLVPALALPCECATAELTPQELVRYSLIVQATVEGVQTGRIRRGAFMRDVDVVEARARKVWRGKAEVGQLVVLQLEKGPCQMELEPGQQYLLFIRRLGNGHVVSRCSPSAPLSEAETQLQQLERLSPG